MRVIVPTYQIFLNSEFIAGFEVYVLAIEYCKDLSKTSKFIFELRDYSLQAETPVSSQLYQNGKCLD